MARNLSALARAAIKTIPVLVGFAVLWAVLDRAAYALGSFRGEAGLVVCAAVLVVAVVIERLLAGKSLRESVADLGLHAPSARAALWSLALGGALLLFYPVFALASGAQLALRPDWVMLAVGMVAQGGVAEEVVFRGFLFRRFREGRSFWRAAWLAAIPFVAVHALLFLSLDFWVALASLLLALSISFPFAWLFDRSGRSIWPSALVHAVIQGSIKLVEVGDAFASMSIAWIALCTIAPWVVFLMRPAETAAGANSGRTG
jgi:membrane protease YdiL (CAAX protease family)